MRPAMRLLIARTVNCPQFAFKKPVLQAFLLVVASAGLDLWFFSLRCAFSPELDWSRFIFGVTIQTLAVAIPLIARNIYSESELKNRSFAAAVAVLLIIFSVPMVRDSILLSDTIANKFYESAGYKCPGVRSL